MSKYVQSCFALVAFILLGFGQLATAQEAAAPTTAPPAVCNPCLFYGGDFNAESSNANALVDELTTGVVSGAFVYVPFVVPEGKVWTVTALFSNNLSYTEVIDPQSAIWSISTGVTQGSGGTAVANGAAPATYTPTGGHGFEMQEYTLMATIIPPVTLTAGEYWMTLVPECKNPIDRACAAASYYLADVAGNSDNHAYGREPRNQAYYFSGEFGYFYWPTWGATGACHGSGCNAFSVGAIGAEVSQ
jgi:hypothetical protein